MKALTNCINLTNRIFLTKSNVTKFGNAVQKPLRRFSQIPINKPEVSQILKNKKTTTISDQTNLSPEELLLKENDTKDLFDQFKNELYESLDDIVASEEELVENYDDIVLDLMISKCPLSKTGEVYIPDYMYSTSIIVLQKHKLVHQAYNIMIRAYLDKIVLDLGVYYKMMKYIASAQLDISFQILTYKMMNENFIPNGKIQEILSLISKSKPKKYKTFFDMVYDDMKKKGVNLMNKRKQFENSGKSLEGKFVVNSYETLSGKNYGGKLSDGHYHEKSGRYHKDSGDRPGDVQMTDKSMNSGGSSIIDIDQNGKKVLDQRQLLGDNGNFILQVPKYIDFSSVADENLIIEEYEDEFESGEDGDEDDNGYYDNFSDTDSDDEIN